MAEEYAPEVVADLQLMVAQSLPRWDLSPATVISLLNLSENATFALSDPGGRELVLRVHRVGYSSAGEIRSELAWINALHRDGAIETATPVPGSNGELLQTLESPSGRPSRYAVAFERLGGREPDSSRDAVQWFERLGELTAKMHRHARSWKLPAGFRRKRATFGQLGNAGLNAALPLMIPVILLGGIMTGWFTPTEAGVVAIVYILLVVIPLLNPRHMRAVWQDFVQAGLIYSLPLITIAAASAFGWLLAYLRGPIVVAGWIGDVAGTDPVTVLMPSTW